MSGRHHRAETFNAFFNAAVDVALAEGFAGGGEAASCGLTPAPRRKNWFIGAEVFETDEPPATDGASPLRLQDKDIRYETLRASGPGGQHVNKTDSAVRATHGPSGLSVKVQTERSQHANKRLARALLAHKLAALESDAATQARQQRWLQHHGVERGNAARTFVGAGFVERMAPA